MKSDFYVYVHKRATDGKVFYVGKGKSRRAFNMTDRGSHHKRIVNKYGVIVEIVENGLQEWYAFELEQNLISYYGRSDLGLGYLVNKTDGGEGEAGQKYSPSRLLEMREITRKVFRENPERLAKNREHLTSVRKSDKFKQGFENFLVKTRSAVIMDESICFKSLTDAALFLGSPDAAKSIGAVCKNKINYHTVQGHVFRYADSDKDEFYRIREQKITQADTTRSAKLKMCVVRKKVIIDGILFKSIKDAANHIGELISSLSNALNRGQLKFKGHSIEFYKE